MSLFRERSKQVTGPHELATCEYEDHTYTYEYFKDPKIGPGPCYHWRVLPSAGGTDFVTPQASKPCNGRSFEFSFHPAVSPALIIQLVRDFSPPPISLNRDKLLTTSDFGLLQAIAEFDDTIAIFTKKFWSQISYGSLTWGVLPFVSELKALADQGKNIVNRAPQNLQYYEDQETHQISEVVTLSSGHQFSIEGEWTYRLTGTVTIPKAGLLELYDRIGFHPDIATVWDLIPLSFVADYILNIGDFLEAVSDRGWIKAASFTGWRTTKFTGYVKGITRLDPNVPGEVFSTLDFTHDVEIFYRTNQLAYPLLDLPDELPKLQWQIPSLKQLGDMGYIFDFGRRFRI